MATRSPLADIFADLQKNSLFGCMEGKTNA
jgi:hypothetical protein